MIGRRSGMPAPQEDRHEPSRGEAAGAVDIALSQGHSDQAVRWYLNSILSARQKRSKYLDERLFAEPAWDILLHVYAAELGMRQRLSVQCLADAARVPASTALRWIRALDAEGLVTCKPIVDAGQAVVGLSEAGRTALGSYFRDIASGAPPA